MLRGSTHLLSFLLIALIIVVSIPVATAISIAKLGRGTQGGVGKALPLADLSRVSVKVINVSVKVEKRVFEFIEPRVAAWVDKRFSDLYREVPGFSNAKLVYVATLGERNAREFVSIYRDLGSSRAIIVIHSAKGKVLGYAIATLTLVRKGSIPARRVDNVTISGRYAVYELNLANVVSKLGKLEDLGVLKLVEEASVKVIELHVRGCIVYDFSPFGKLKTVLKGIVWIKVEASGSREIIRAIEHGSHLERLGALSYLFSTCWFRAWPEYNPFIALIKASWGIAENTCPATTRCYARPALLVYPNERISLDPGGPDCGLELGCGCYGWSGSLNTSVSHAIS